MNSLVLENIISNISFCSLFLSTILYIYQIVFKISKFLDIFLQKYSIQINYFILNTILILRWINSHHFPLSNLYESLLFLTWSLITFQIFNQKLFKNQLLNGLIISFCFIIVSFSTLCLPPEMKQISPLVPALKSNWLLMHVSIILLSYGALLLGSFFSMLFLIIQNNQNLLELRQSCSELSYKFIGFGFPLLTLGIISGAVWANQAWGSYWSWDPKETWSLITWLTFAIYLHNRLIKKSSLQESAKIASLGFFVIGVCYFGVNLLGKGLHSYGWWS